jgi:hypothetical protein
VVVWFHRAAAQLDAAVADAVARFPPHAGASGRGPRRPFPPSHRADLVSCAENSGPGVEWRSWHPKVHQILHLSVHREFSMRDAAHGLPCKSAFWIGDANLYVERGGARWGDGALA